MRIVHRQHVRQRDQRSDTIDLLQLGYLRVVLLRDLFDLMVVVLDSLGQRLYFLKQWIIKSVIGFRQFHVRGLDAASGEWTLVTMAWNIKRLFNLKSAAARPAAAACLKTPVNEPQTLDHCCPTVQKFPRGPVPGILASFPPPVVGVCDSGKF
jgi:hypothetical protein